MNGVKEPVLFSFHLNKPPGPKVYFEQETSHSKKKIYLFLVK